MGWRVALGLLKLRDQVDEAFPGRNKASDGTIGDAAHASTTSDHNPDWSGVVRALDLTHDPAHGADMGRISEALRKSQDPRIAYLIFNRRIVSSTVNPWVWRAYSGSDPHTNHMHVSTVRDNSISDRQSSWAIGVEPEEEIDMASMVEIMARLDEVRSLAATCERILVSGAAKLEEDSPLFRPPSGDPERIMLPFTLDGVYPTVPNPWVYLANRLENAAGGLTDEDRELIRALVSRIDSQLQAP